MFKFTKLHIMNKITSMELLNLTRLRYQFFPSHLVDRSLWPILLSFSLFSLAISAVEYMHGYSTGSLLLRAATVLTLIGMALWWKDVVIEATFGGHHTKKVRNGILQGFVLFVVSEVMVFLSVFWAYGHSSLSPAVEIGGCWPCFIIILSFYFFTFIAINIQLLFFYLFIKAVNIVNNIINSFASPSTEDLSGNEKGTCNKNDILDETKKNFDDISKSFDPSLIKIDLFKFKSFINGLFQAEGTISLQFKVADSLRLGFYFSIGQNFSTEAAKLFLMLQYVLGGIGRFKFEALESGKTHIRYVVTNKDEIINVIIPYFSLLYGDKKFAILKLNRILKIIDILSISFNIKLAYELIVLVYSLNPDGQSRKLSLIEKLEKLNILPNSFLDIELTEYHQENNQLPDIFFIIGLFIGDGSLYFSLETRSHPKFYLRVTCDICTLKNSSNSKHLLTLVAKSLGLPVNLYLNGSSGMLTLQYKGLVVLKKILVLFNNNIEFLFWRKSLVLMATNIKKMVEDKTHLTKAGKIQIVNMLYSKPNYYKKSKDFWLQLIEEHKK